MYTNDLILELAHQISPPGDRQLDQEQEKGRRPGPQHT